MSSQAAPLIIDVPNLRRVLNALLDHVERDDGSLIEVDRDHYWLLALSAMFSQDLHQPGSAPNDFGVGQISDDVETVAALARAIEQGDPVLSPWHDLEHVVGLLRALAWRNLP